MKKDKQIDGMTIKDISKLCGKNETTIARWIKEPNKESCKMQGDLPAKCRVIAKTLKHAQFSKTPALFNKDEVLTIIRASGNELLANMLNLSTPSSALATTSKSLITHTQAKELVTTIINKPFMRELIDKVMEELMAELPLSDERALFVKLINNQAPKFGMKPQELYTEVYHYLEEQLDEEIYEASELIGINKISYLHHMGLLKKSLKITLEYIKEKQECV